MVVYPAQTIFLSIVGCKLLQLMRKRFTWKLDQSMRIRIQVLLLEPSSLLMILCGELAVRFHCSSDASVIGLCGYIYKKFMVVVSADVKVRVYIKPSSQRGGREHKNACFILRRGVSRYRFLRFFLHPLRFLHRQFICRCKDNGKATLDYDFQGFFLPSP
ncbi:hypothetical protein Bca101_097638 [Brassica carinata]